MQVIQTPAEMQALAESVRVDGRRLALVPTMGALHDGHLELVRAARAKADHVTVSIFVNPTQFGPSEDYTRYPRTLDADLTKLDALGGVDVVFAPDAASMYPHGEPLTWVQVDALDAHLCGAHRPGHFRGVTTVVAKLFNVCRPHTAVFGLKDAQQYVILKRMASELFFGVELVGVPTDREPSGLARSSRNAYLTDDERRQAARLFEAVDAARRAVEEGEQRGEALVEAMRRTLAQAPDARVQYAEVVDADTLRPVEHVAPGRRLIAAAAVYFGRTRLIDNAFVRAPRPSADTTQ